jgi:hypothetical protein
MWCNENSFTVLVGVRISTATLENWFYKVEHKDTLWPASSTPASLPYVPMFPVESSTVPSPKLQQQWDTW